MGAVMGFGGGSLWPWTCRLGFRFRGVVWISSGISAPVQSAVQLAFLGQLGR